MEATLEHLRERAEFQKRVREHPEDVGPDVDLKVRVARLLAAAYRIADCEVKHHLAHAQGASDGRLRELGDRTKEARDRLRRLLTEALGGDLR